jgi:hypothetical protein
LPPLVTHCDATSRLREPTFAGGRQKGETPEARIGRRSYFREEASIMFDRLIQDLRFALRQLLRHPAFSVLLVLTIAVAIGANVAIFSVLEGIVLRPMSYPEPERLLAVWETPPEGRWYQPFSAPDYFDVRDQVETLEELGVIQLRWFNLSGGGGKPQGGGSQSRSLAGPVRGRPGHPGSNGLRQR